MTMRFWGMLVGLCIASLIHSAQLKNINISSQQDKISLYLSIDGSFTHQVFVLTNPNRLVVDLNPMVLGFPLQGLNKNCSLIQKLRSGVANNKTLRLVFDLNATVQARSSVWQSKGLKIDLIKNKINTPMMVKHQDMKALKPPTKAYLLGHQAQIRHSQPIKVPHSPSNQRRRDVVIVLDAGHGGKDPGAKGPARSQEKNVVLAITLKLKQLIDKQPGMRAVLTRSGDYYVGLRQRIDKARQYNGDIFVSIHADAFNNPHSNGASVFALSQRGATSEAARWIAEKENYSELGGVNLGDLDDSNGVVRSVLIDLSQTATINSSLQMGGRVLRQLNQLTRLHNDKVEQAGFVVLKSTDIPSILIETGFISNPIEERNLTNPRYQFRLSQAIFQGIKQYFWENPPHGTRIEAWA